MSHIKQENVTVRDWHVTTYNEDAVKQASTARAFVPSQGSYWNGEYTTSNPVGGKHVDIVIIDTANDEVLAAYHVIGFVSESEYAKVEQLFGPGVVVSRKLQKH